MYAWKSLDIKRFYGIDQKTNVVDVKDSESIDAQNVFQDKRGVISKRSGNSVMFSTDSTSSAIRIDEIGTCTLSGTKYYYKFYDGKFGYATSLTGAVTEISPSPAISTNVDIWCVALDDKLFFVDGTNALRYFDGSAISVSSIYTRPTVALTTATVGTGYDYVYTVDNGNGESPACSSALVNAASGASVVLDLTDNPGTDDILAGYVVKVYSKATTIAAAYKLVATYTITAGDVAATTATIGTVAITDEQDNLYTELGSAANKTAPTGLKGIIAHYGRLVGWKDDYVYNSKISNPHSWPDNAAVGDSFVYGFGLGDGEDITCCVSYLESMFVMKPTKIAVFAGIGPDDTGGNAYAFRRLETNGIGCISPKSAVVVGEEQGNMLVFLSREGFYASTGNNPVRIGENIENNIQGISDSILSRSHAFHYKKDGFYICFVGSDSSKTCWLIDTKKDKGVMVGWFKLTGLNATCVFWDTDRYIFGTSTGLCLSQRVSDTASDFSDAFVEYVAAASINTGTDVITVTKSYTTGDEVTVRTTGTIPAGLVANTQYYAIRVSATEIKLATSLANANLGTAIDITTQGVGTHTLVSKNPISAYYTTNWIKFGNAALVKKLGKPCIVFNATATEISLTMSSAYDWVPNFIDEQTIEITSSHLWGSGTWGSFVWGGGVVAQPKNVAIARRKCRSVRYKFVNNELNEDFNLQGLIQEFAYIRNRSNFA